MISHAAIDKSQPVQFICDRRFCGRTADKPFGRKDHYRDHLRDYHKEDIGSARVPKNCANPEEVRKMWLEGRVIDEMAMQ